MYLRKIETFQNGFSKTPNFEKWIFEKSKVLINEFSKAPNFEKLIFKHI
jgi:hypothetical protein